MGFCKAGSGMYERRGIAAIRGADANPSSGLSLRHGYQICVVALAGVMVLVAAQAAAQVSQQPSGVRTDKIDAPTPINQPPDAIVQMKAKDHDSARKNFDRANAIRIQQIEDESNKLLILARDVKSQMDKVGDKPLPPVLMRETDVIRILAHDVQAKMTLTVGAS